MTVRIVLPWTLLSILLIACSSNPEKPPISHEVFRSPLAPVSLEGFLVLDQDDRAERSSIADHQLEDVHREVGKRRPMVINEFRKRRGGNMMTLKIDAPKQKYEYQLLTLQRITTVDPTQTSAWIELGQCLALIGDHEGALNAFTQAADAVAHDTRLPGAAMMLRRLDERRARCLRELGRSSEGLDLMKTMEREYATAPLESRITYGLLLGDSGRLSAAYDVAMSIDPVQYPNIHIYTEHRASLRGSSYVQRWIKAVAWLGLGDPVMARHALGELNFYRLTFPFYSEFWQDAGLVCELSGDIESARLAYANAFGPKEDLLPFMLGDAFSTMSVIEGVPDIRIPAFSADDVFLLGGSLFTLGVQLMSECPHTTDEVEKERRGRAAERIFTTCLNRNIRPLLSLALRGRTRYYLQEFETAESDLIQACRDFEEQGRNDPGSLLVLGTIQYENGRSDKAVHHLHRAIEADPSMAGAWRTLGVALAKLNRSDEALTAMTRAIELEPGSSRGWHNRGFFHSEHDRLVDAAVDLGVALRIAPGNSTTLQLAQQVSRDLGANGRNEDLLRAIAVSDSLAASVRSVAEDRFEDRPGVVTLGARRGLNVPAPEPIDAAALADSLASAYELTPNTVLRRELADAYLRCDREDEALSLMTGIDPATRDDLVVLLRIDRRHGDPSRALMLARSDDATLNSELWSLIALVCLDHGHRVEGLSALDRAVAADPDNIGLKSYREFLVSHP